MVTWTFCRQKQNVDPPAWLCRAAHTTVVSMLESPRPRVHCWVCAALLCLVPVSLPLSFLFILLNRFYCPVHHAGTFLCDVKIWEMAIYCLFFVFVLCFSFSLWLCKPANCLAIYAVFCLCCLLLSQQLKGYKRTYIFLKRHEKMISCFFSGLNVKEQSPVR